MKLPKKYRPLALALAVLVLVGAAYAMIILLTPEEPEEEKEDPAADYVSLVDYELKALDHVDFSFADGYQYTIQLTHKSESSRSYAVVGKEEYDFSFSDMSSACLALCGINSSRLVEENAADLEQFGLTEPRAVVTICGTDGTSHVIAVGNETAVGSYSYVTADNGNDVYLVSSYTTRYLLSKDYEYRETDVLSLDTDDPSTDVQAMSVTDHGTEVFSYTTLTTEEAEAIDPDMTNLLYMTVPTEHGVNGTTLNDYLLGNMVSITFDDVIEDAPTDLSAYGLEDENALILNIDLTDGSSVNLKLSDETEDGIRYGVIGGVNSVVTFDAEDFAFLDGFDYSSLIYRLIWTYNIQELSGFDVTAHGETHSVALFDPTDDEEEAGEVFWATFDGEELREENARRLYVRVLSPSVYNMTDEEMDASVEEEAEWSCVIHFDTGRSDETIAFHKINARQYAAYRNGEPTGFYVNVLDLQAIDEGLELIAKNDLIPD